MSILIKYSELKQDEVTDMLVIDKQRNTLKRMYPYRREQDAVFIPFAYARSIGFNSIQHTKEVEYTFKSTLYERQVNMKENAMNKLEKDRYLLLGLHVGWGKTTFSLYLGSCLKRRILIICPASLLKQWQSEAMKHVGEHAFIIYPRKPIDDTKNIYIINAQNVEKLPSSFLASIGTCIVDEIHKICAEKTHTCLYSIVPQYLIGLSATPYREDGYHKLIELYFGTQPIMTKLEKPHKVYMVQTNLELDFELQYDGRINWNSLLESQANHPERLDIIMRILIHFSDRVFIVLCKRKDLATAIYERCKAINESVELYIGNKKDFNINVRIFIGTTTKCGVGFSSNTFNALLVASDIEAYYIQNLGRVFRTNDASPIVFDLVDSHNRLHAHWLTRQKVYKESKGDIKKIQPHQIETLSI